MSPSIPASTEEVQKKCSVKTCSYRIRVADSRKMCERCRNTQAEQSRKKRERKREKEDAAGTLIKRRAPSKPKPPLYRIPNVGLFTERDWPHLDKRLFKIPKLVVQDADDDHILTPEPGPSRRKDGYVRNPPPAKEDGAKELVAVKICHIKGCFQPIPIEHTLACIDCHERRASYIQERKRRRDQEAANITTFTVEVPSQPSTLQDYCSVIRFDDDYLVQSPGHLSTPNDERIPTQSNDLSLILTPINHPTGPNGDASHTQSSDFSPVIASIHKPPVSNKTTTETVDISPTGTQTPPIRKALPTHPGAIPPVDIISSNVYDAPYQQISFERHQVPNAGLNQVVTISSGCDDDDDVNMEEGEETQSDMHCERGRADHLYYHGMCEW